MWTDQEDRLIRMEAQQQEQMRILHSHTQSLETIMEYFRQQQQQQEEDDEEDEDDDDDE